MTNIHPTKKYGIIATGSELYWVESIKGFGFVGDGWDAMKFNNEQAAIGYTKELIFRSAAAADAAGSLDSYKAADLAVVEMQVTQTMSAVS